MMSMLTPSTFGRFSVPFDRDLKEKVEKLSDESLLSSDVLSDVFLARLEKRGAQGVIEFPHPNK